MDLNELLSAHQRAVMRVADIADRKNSDAHQRKVAEYAERIGQLREMNQMSDTSKAPDAPQTIVYGSYAGDVAEPTVEAKPAAAGAVNDWEDEGGSLDPPVDPQPTPQLPDGVSMKVVHHYHVGPYVYQDLGLALVEHLRQQSAGDDKQSA